MSKNLTLSSGVKVVDEFLRSRAESLCEAKMSYSVFLEGKLLRENNRGKRLAQARGRCVKVSCGLATYRRRDHCGSW